MLQRASSWLARGGTLVFATCSLEPEEGEAHARRLPLSLDPVRVDEFPAGIVPTAEGWLRTDPGMLAEHGGIDGFFIARFVNKA